PIRRAKALGIMANPNATLDLMHRAAPEGENDVTDSVPTKSAAEEGGPWPEVTLYIHFTRDQWRRDRDGATTLEGVGPVTLTQSRDVLGHARVTIRPVIDLENMPTSDDRFVRGRMREAVILKNPHCIFPFCNRRSRQNQADHTVPWPRGKTAIDNLSPPDGKHHRAKTHAGWRLAQAINGIYVWKSPHGRVYVVDHRGVTHDLGLPGAKEGLPAERRNGRACR
ncbi:MAG: HNH endonuclease signature motif containing protein, partial [Nocardioidaceae bacterium]